mmetsp:Transcript_28723/g.67074  ORF Transcript_28723/g.67074 Transcript_28723/m.67074 type:complete len:230 (-) Transcript_28723:2849-3538(-)
MSPRGTRRRATQSTRHCTRTGTTTWSRRASPSLPRTTCTAWTPRRRRRCLLCRGRKRRCPRRSCSSQPRTACRGRRRCPCSRRCRCRLTWPRTQQATTSCQRTRCTRTTTLLLLRLSTCLRRTGCSSATRWPACTSPPRRWCTCRRRGPCTPRCTRTGRWRCCQRASASWRGTSRTTTRPSRPWSRGTCPPRTGCTTRSRPPPCSSPPRTRRTARRRPRCTLRCRGSLL